MSLFKNLSQMSSTIIIRFGISLVTMSIVARTLGTESFGIFMLYLSISTLSLLPANLGLNNYVLKEIPTLHNANNFISEALTYKVLFTIIISSLVILIMLSSDYIEERFVFIFIFLSILSESFIDYFLNCIRARNQFYKDFIYNSISSVFSFLTIFIVTRLSSGLDVISLSWFFTRIVSLLFLYLILFNVFGSIKLILSTPYLKWIKNTYAYAFDSILSSLFGNVDSIILSSTLGSNAVGIYQAGMRLVLTSIQSAVVVSNVFLPRASLAYGTRQFGSEIIKLQSAFILLSIVFYFSFNFLGNYIVEVVYGESYSSLIDLMPFLGFLCALRFLVASSGIVITSSGGQEYRTKTNLYSWLVTFALSPVLIINFEIYGWILSIIVGHLFLLCAYIYWTIKNGFINNYIIGVQILMLLIFVFGIV